MKRGGGKGKGSAFERVVCKQLSAWVSAGKRDDLFWRTAGSGARATQVFKASGRTVQGVGDVVSVHPDSAWVTAAFAVEAKHLKDLKLAGDVFFGLTSGIGFHWKKICEQAADADRLPMLIARQNGRPTILWLPAGLCNGLVRQRRLDRVLISVSRYPDAVAVGFDEFLAAVPPQVLRESLPSCGHTK